MKQKRVWDQIKTYLSRFLFPSLCLHCDQPLEEGAALFCKECSALFEWIDPLSRCPFCFVENERKSPCPACRHKKPHVQMAAACDALPPVQTLVRELKKGAYPFLAKTAAAFLLLQFERLGWPVPDGIVPIPPRIRWQGADAVFKIATILAQNFQTKLLPVLGRRLGDFPASRISPNCRAQTRSFYLKKGKGVEDKILLLVDDELVTTQTLQRAAEALQGGFPKRLYALTLARSLQERSDE